jgi:ABC transport system ATP-binding/permease protein
VSIVPIPNGAELLAAYSVCISDASPNSIVSASELVVRYGVQAVLDHATLTIHQGERVGLVGRNGSGKSTFLQIAAGILQPDAGEFVRRRDLVTGYMSQALMLDESATVFTNIRTGAQHILDLIAEYQRFLAESLQAPRCSTRSITSTAGTLSIESKA